MTAVVARLTEEHAMPSTERTITTCPACSRTTLVDHCYDEGKCGWSKCRNKDCDLVINAKGSGHRLVAKGYGSRERWVA